MKTGGILVRLFFLHLAVLCFALPGTLPAIPVITSGTLVTGTAGLPLNYQIVATESQEIYNAIGLPTGLSVDTANGLISGTPMLSGTFYATISVANSFYNQTLLKIIIKDPTDIWKTSNFSSIELSNTSISGDTVSVVQDGVPNLMKYALNLDPHASGLYGLPVSGTASISGTDYLTLTFAQRKSACNITYAVEASGDLIHWDSTSPVVVGCCNNLDGITQSVEVRDSMPLSAGPRFLRLRATRSTGLPTNYSATQAAAETAMDFAYTTWLSRINSKKGILLASSSDLAVTGPSFSGTGAQYVYYAGTSGSDGWLRIQALDQNGVPLPSGVAPVGVSVGVPGYPGWWGRTYSYVATAMLQPVGSLSPVGVRRVFQYTDVPLFQAMFFFQDDLEIYNPAPIVLSGLVHTNSNLYLSVTNSSDLRINGLASYVGSYSTLEPPGAVGSNYNQGNLSPPTWNGGGQSAQLSQGLPMQPLGPGLGADFPPPYGTNPDPSALTDPNLQNGYHELIEPPSSATSDPPELTHCRLYNKAGLIIQVSGTNHTYGTAPVSLASTKTGTTLLNYLTAMYGVTLTAQNGASLPDPSTTIGATAYINAYNAITKSLVKQNATDTINVFYDARVGSKVNIVSLDISLLATNGGALVNNTNAGYLGSGFNGVIYIYDSTTSTYPNTLRLRNGNILPSDPNNSSQGLTVVSVNPIYIEGDYNTGLAPPSSGSSPTSSSSPTGSGYTRLPAAVIGDAIMLLSNSWLDSNSTKSLPSRPASNTTYNTCLLGGFMPSANGYYSGGAVNYPRFLEDWNSKYCTYWGSMVELFPSKTFTQHWVLPGAYYTAPNRYYNFDPNYSYTAPPGTTTAVILSQGASSNF